MRINISSAAKYTSARGPMNLCVKRNFYFHNSPIYRKTAERTPFKQKWKPGHTLKITNGYMYFRSRSVTIICKNLPNHMENVVLHQTGILQLEPSCKGYTDFFLLKTTSSTSRNISHYVPKLDITTDDCCLLTRRFNKIVPVQLAPIKLMTTDLSELGYANKKLDEFRRNSKRPIKQTIHSTTH